MNGPPTTVRSRRTADAILLTLSLCVLAAAAILTVRGAEQVALFGFTLPEICFWRRFLGIECPGCGLTRSFVSLGHGQWRAAWEFHMLGPALFALVAIQPPYRLWRLWRARESHAGQGAA